MSRLLLAERKTTITKIITLYNPGEEKSTSGFIPLSQEQISEATGSLKLDWSKDQIDIYYVIINGPDIPSSGTGVFIKLLSK